MTLVTLSRRAPTELPDGAYDVRGWEVRTALDSKKVGKVDDMLLDDRGSPRFLDVNLGLFKRHVLVPLAEAHAEPSDQVIWIDRLDEERLARIPEYDHDPERLSPEYERRLTDEYGALASEARDRPAPEVVEERPMGGLARLGDLGDFRVAKGVTDPRGWKVVAGDGTKLGEVSELIVDQGSLSTRYLDVKVDEKPLELEPLDRHVLIPAERVRLDRKGKHVVADGLFARDLGTYPVYGGLPLDRDTELRLARAWERDGDRRPADPETVRFFGARARPGDTAPGAQARRMRIRDGRMGDEESHEDDSILAGDGDEVRIRVSGDDIVIERNPRGRSEDG